MAVPHRTPSSRGAQRHSNDIGHAVESARDDQKRPAPADTDKDLDADEVRYKRSRTKKTKTRHQAAEEHTGASDHAEGRKQRAGLDSSRVDLNIEITVDGQKAPTTANLGDGEEVMEALKDFVQQDGGAELRKGAESTVKGKQSHNQDTSHMGHVTERSLTAASFLHCGIPPVTINESGLDTDDDYEDGLDSQDDEHDDSGSCAADYASDCEGTDSDWEDYDSDCASVSSSGNSHNNDDYDEEDDEPAPATPPKPPPSNLCSDHPYLTESTLDFAALLAKEGFQKRPRAVWDLLEYQKLPRHAQARGKRFYETLLSTVRGNPLTRTLIPQFQYLPGIGLWADAWSRCSFDMAMLRKVKIDGRETQRLECMLAIVIHEEPALGKLVDKVSRGENLTRADLGRLRNAKGLSKAGLYIIYINGRWYVGMSKDIDKRTCSHSPTNRYYKAWVAQHKGAERIKKVLTVFKEGAPRRKIFCAEAMLNLALCASIKNKGLNKRVYDIRPDGVEVSHDLLCRVVEHVAKKYHAKGKGWVLPPAYAKARHNAKRWERLFADFDLEDSTATRMSRMFYHPGSREMELQLLLEKHDIDDGIYLDGRNWRNKVFRGTTTKATANAIQRDEHVLPGCATGSADEGHNTAIQRQELTIARFSNLGRPARIGQPKPTVPKAPFKRR